jgi:lipopolysaccharide export system protein LptC
MMIYADKAMRPDPDHLEMTTAYMQTYDDKGAPDLGITMTRSVLDLNTRIVTSDVPVTVSRTDFLIIGQNMSFNSQTRAGHMSGHVHTVIYNLQAAAGASPSPSPSPAASIPTPDNPKP